MPGPPCCPSLPHEEGAGAGAGAGAGPAPALAPARPLHLPALALTVSAVISLVMAACCALMFWILDSSSEVSTCSSARLFPPSSVAPSSGCTSPICTTRPLLHVSPACERGHAHARQCWSAAQCILRPGWQQARGRCWKEHAPSSHTALASPSKGIIARPQGLGSMSLPSSRHWDFFCVRTIPHSGCCLPGPHTPVKD